MLVVNEDRVKFSVTPSEGQSIDQEELEAVKESYKATTDRTLEQKFERHASNLLEKLAQPVESFDELDAELPSELEPNGGFLDTPDFDAFNDELLLSFNISGNVPTANLIAEKHMGNYKLTVAAEPEAERSYAILKYPDSSSSNGPYMINLDRENSVATSACIVGNECKETYGYPCEGCAKQSKSYQFEVHCCDGYCEWGSQIYDSDGNAELCSCSDACPKCEYWCATWDTCNG